LIATLVLAGLRVGEALSLRWKSIDLANGRLYVGQAKTDAGVRTVDLSPDLRDELANYRMGSRFEGPDDLVFPTKNGRPQNTNNVLSRVVRGAVKEANKRLAKKELPLIPERLKTHSLRHTFASLLFEAGASPPYVMAQLGHTDPGFTLRVYAHVLRRKRDHGERMDELVKGADWAATGSGEDSEVPQADGSAEPSNEKPRVSRASLSAPGRI
jgi:integrase